jgi:hypothetical protein
MTLVTVGVIPYESLKLISHAFPEMEKILNMSNRFLFDIGRKSVEYDLKVN